MTATIAVPNAHPKSANRTRLRQSGILVAAMLAGVTGCVTSPAIPLATAPMQPEKFQPERISTGNVFSSSFSADGLSLLLVRSSADRQQMSVYESRFQDGQWQTPQPVSFNSAHRDIDAIFSRDGKTVLFNSTRPRHPGDTRTDFDILVVERVDEGWSEPRWLPAPINSTNAESYAVDSDNGNLYYTHRVEPDGKSDLYIARKRGDGYDAPERLSDAINSEFAEGNPYIAPDESYLLFLSDRPGGYGSTDLYISYRQDDGWTPAENLGPLINTDGGEFCPVISPDGRTLFFSRSTFKDGKRIADDIYHVDLRAVLPQLRRQ